MFGWLGAIKSLVSGKKARQSAAARKRRSSPFRVEQLETRVTPATLALLGDVLTYSAVAGETNNLTVSVTGGTYTFRDNGATITAVPAGWVGAGTNTATGPDAGINSISINLTAGNENDTVNLQSVNQPTTVLGNNGNNTFNVSSNAPTNTGNLAGINGALTFTAGTGANRLTVSDFGAATGNANVVAAGGSITGLAGPTDGSAINYTGTYNLIRVIGSNAVSLAESFTVDNPGGVFRLDANGGNDTANLRNATASVTLSLGAGSDTINVSSDAPANLGSLDGITAAVTIDGGTGVNAIRVSNFGKAAGTVNATVTATSVTGLAPATISYSALGGSFSQVRLDGSDTLGDTFTVNSTLGAVTTINGNGGADSFVLGAAAVTVGLNGGAGSDTVQGFNGANNWQIPGADAGSVNTNATFTGVENLTGGTGVDTFNFGAAGSLSGNANGGAGTDTINGTNAANTYTINGANAGNIGALLGSFSNVENLVAGTGNDSFVFVTGGSLTGTITAGTGTDTLTTTNAGNTVNVTGTDAGNIATILPAGYTGVENLVGGTGNDTFAFAAAGVVSGTINGGDGTDTIVGTNANTTYSINGANAGTIGVILVNGFTNVESLTGGTGTDTFTFGAAGSLAGTINGGAGTDTLNGNNNGNAFNFTAADVGNITGVLGSFTGIESLVGGTGADSFTFGAAGTFAGTINAGAGSDTVAGNDAGNTFNVTGTDAGNVATLLPAGFTSVENLVGGSGNDSFAFGAAGVLSGTINGGGGTDTIVGTNANTTYSVTGANAGTISGILTAGFTNVESLTAGTGTDSFTFGAAGSLAGTVAGGAGTDTITGNDNGNAYNITGADAGNITGVLGAFTGVEVLVGGTGNDNFTFVTGGSLTGTITGGAGSDTVTTTNAGNTVNVTAANAGNIATILTAGFTSVENLVGGTGADTFAFGAAGSLTGTINGGAGSDTIAGNDAGNTYNITGTNSGNIVTLLPAGFTNVENLIGGSGNDTFAFTTAGFLNGNIHGGAPTTEPGDTIDYSALAPEVGSVDYANFTTSGLGGVWASIETFINVALTVGDGLNVWTITGLNSGTVSSDGGAPVAFTASALQGGTGQDDFIFLAGGSLSGTISGGGGTGINTITGDNGGRTFNVNGTNSGSIPGLLGGSYSSIQNLVGGTGNDSFAFGATGSLAGTINGGTGNDTISGTSAATYTVTGANAGNITGLLPGGFTSVENLTGGAGADSFTFGAAGSLTGSVNGGGGSDTITGTNANTTYSVTGADAGTITGLLSSFTSVENLVAGSGTDSFTFGAAGSLTGAVNGGGGSDTITGNDAGSAYSVTGADAGSITGLLGSFTSVEHLVGGAGTDSFTFGASGTLTGTVNGGAGTDTIAGTNAATYAVTGANAGTVSGHLPGGFTNVESLAGGGAADSFTFATGSSLAGTINGGGGSDTITGTDAGNAYSISGADAGSIATLLTNGFTSVENLVGGTGSDSFTFGAAGTLSGTITGGAGSDTLTGNDAGNTYNITGADAGNVATLLTNGFTSVESLVGGSGADSFAFGAAGVLSGTINGGGGSDTITGNNAAATYTVNGADAGTISGILTAGFTSVENLVAGTGNDSIVFATGGSLAGSVNGGAGTDTITGTNAGNAFSVSGTDAGSIAAVLGSFTSVENLVGGTGNDSFAFGAAGVLSGTINGGAGSDTIAGNNNGNTFNVTGADAGNVATLLTNGFTSVENLTGGSGIDNFVFGAAGSLTGTVNGGGGSDTITGTDAGNAYSVTGTDAGSITTLLGSFTSVENLVGGTGTDSFTFGAAGVLSGTINGGAGSDTLAGNNAGNTYNVTGANAGNVATLLTNGFTSVENLVGGTGNDSFTFGAAGSLTGTINGGTGSDTITGTDAATTYTVTGADAGTISGILSAGFTSVENLTAGTGADSIVFATGGSLTGSVNGGAGTDTITGTNAGNAFSVNGTDAGSIAAVLGSFTSVENLVGGTANDSFTFGAAGVLSGTINGGTGTDTIAGNDAANTYNITGADAGNVATLLTNGFTSVENLTGGTGADSFVFGAAGSLTGSINGGAGTDTITGNNAANTYTVNGANAGNIGALLGSFTAVENLVAGTANDSIVFVTGGSLSGTVAAGAGTDTLTTTNAGNTVNITGADAGNVATILAAGFTSVENLVGGSGADTFAFGAAGSLTGTINGGTGSDTIAGNDAATTYNVTGADAGNIGGILPAGFTSVENLTGGSGIDNFVFGAAGSLTGAITGGAGSDVLTGNNAANTYNITGADAGNITSLLGSFTGVENLVAGTGNDSFTFGAAGALSGTITGGTGTDTLTGNDAGNTFNVTGADAGNVATLLTNGFTSVENLVGGSGADSFAFAAAGVLTGTINGGAGTDTIAGTNVATTYTVTGSNAGNITGILPAGFTNVESLTAGTDADSFLFVTGGSLAGTVNGGAGTDTITGTNAGNAFSVSGTDAGSIAAVLGSFTGVENLVGGTGNDTFAFGAAGVLSGTINGGTGTDTLTGNDAGNTYNVTGTDAGNVATLLTNGFTSVENLVGGSGADTFAFGAAGSLTGAINGGAGSDTIVGTNVATTYTVTGADAGNITGILPAGFTAVENLTAGTAGDSFVFGAAGSLTGAINGGAGTDTITGNNAANAYSVSGTDAGSITGLLGSFTSVEHLVGGTGADNFTFGAAGVLSGTITGGAGSDTVTGNNAGNTFNVTGADAGNVATLLTNGFTSVENLTGGTGNDSFLFGAAGSLTGSINGGDGSDTITGTDAAATYTVNGANAGNITGILPAGFTNVENLTAGTGNDNFTFGAAGSLAGSINAGGGTDVLTGNDAGDAFNVTGSDAGNITGLLGSFSAVEHLVGGSGADSFTFGAAGTLTGTINGGGGSDTVAGNNNANTFNITGANSGDVAVLLIAGFTSVENLTGGTGADSFLFGDAGTLSGTINGGAGTDTITGTNGANTYNVTGADAGNITSLLGSFTSVENLVAGTGNDSFVFVTGGSLTGSITAGNGTDTITGGNGGSAFNVTNPDAGNITAVLGSFTSVEFLVGGTGNDSFTFGATGTLTGTINGGNGSDTVAGNNNANTFNITGADLGNIPTLLPAGFTLVENLTGGTANDSFLFATAATLSGTINGGGGTDTITGNNAATTYNVTGADAGNITAVLGAFTSVENLVAGTGNDSFVFVTGGSLTGTITASGGTDTLTGTNAGNTFNVTGADVGNVATILAAGFTSVENLVGGTGSDSFTFGATGSLTGTVNGGDGTDTIAGNNNATTYNVTGANAGNASGILPAGFTNVESLTGGTAADGFVFGATGSLAGTVNGGAGTDTITGNNNGNAFSVTGANAGSIAVLLGAFTAVENLVGGTGNDSFTVSGTGSLTGSVAGNAGADTLSYAGYTAGAVSVRLASSAAAGFTTATATALGGASGINTLVGSGGLADVLTGIDVFNVWQLGATRTYNDLGVGNQTLTFSALEVLNGGGDADLFNVTQTTAGTPLALNGNGQDDVFFIGFDSLTQTPNNGTLAGLLGNVTVDGGGDLDDFMEISDAAFTTGVSWLLESGSVQRSGAGTIGYNRLIRVNVTLGAPTGVNNAVDIESLDSGVSLTVSAQGRSDVTISAAAGNLDALAGGTLVLTGTPTDTLTVNDALTTGATTYTVSGLSINYAGSGLHSGSIFVFSPFGQVVVLGGSGTNTFFVDPSIDTTVSVHGGSSGTSSLFYLAPFSSNPFNDGIFSIVDLTNLYRPVYYYNFASVQIIPGMLPG